MSVGAAVVGRIGEAVSVGAGAKVVVMDGTNVVEVAIGL